MDERRWSPAIQSFCDEYPIPNNALHCGRAKPKASDIVIVLPSTSMAAHAADKYVEFIETEENLEVAGNATRRAGKGTPSSIPEYPFLPQPPLLPPGGCWEVSSITKAAHI
ncbi:hypothetical protein HAX54_022130 [Datura stramonium]|uniref:Uncharacterized protein n=1 Tax=Datura stramonium TaxID=4076 RepID=A0ABS8S4G9_DATST|nr:hypothetical protein [Datura stramonium]